MLVTKVGMMTQDIKLIAVDLDGTLLNTDHNMSEKNEAALKAAMDKGVKVVVATGKTRASADALIERLSLDTPGIYNQGLVIYDASGKITHQKTLDPSIARQVITFAEDRGFHMVAYSGSRLMVRALAPESEELTTVYHEPMPEAVGPLQNILDELPVNKLMAVKKDEPRRVKALRWQLSMQLDGKGRLVQSMIPYQLEILPPTGSKGLALQTVAKDLGVDVNQILAIGDGENDIEMLKVAGIGVAMGDGSQKLKDVADHIVATADENGVAEAVERFVLTSAAGSTENSDASKGES